MPINFAISFIIFGYFFTYLDISSGSLFEFLIIEIWVRVMVGEFGSFLQIVNYSLSTGTIAVDEDVLYLIITFPL
jgi:hypothetical protein